MLTGARWGGSGGSRRRQLCGPREGQVLTRRPTSRRRATLYQMRQPISARTDEPGLRGCGRGARVESAWRAERVLSTHRVRHAGRPRFGYLSARIGQSKKRSRPRSRRSTSNMSSSLERHAKGKSGCSTLHGPKLRRTDSRTAISVVPFTDGKTYDDVLPAINLAFILPSSKPYVRPRERACARRMDQLKASSEFNFSQTTGEPSGSGGNPNLDPGARTRSTCRTKSIR